MIGFESQNLFIGTGYGMVVPAAGPVQKNRRKDYVSGGPGWLQPQNLHTLPPGLDDIVAAFGPRVYQSMLHDATVRSSFGSLKLGVVDGGISLSSPVKMPAWLSQTPTRAPKLRNEGKTGPDGKPAPGQVKEAADTPPGVREGLSGDQRRAMEIHEFCERGIARLGDQLDAAAFGLLDSMAFGAKIAEWTCAVPDEGADKGKLVLDSIKVRPNWAWRFLVDTFMNVRGILTWNPSTGEYQVVDPAKFGIMSWMPEDGDPRGTSILRAAYMAWNLKIQAWPMYYQHLVRFGSLGVDIEMAEGDNLDRQPLDADGNEIPYNPADPKTFPVSAEQYMIQAVTHYKNGGSFIHPFGSKVTAFEPRSNGEAFINAFDVFDRQICLAIEMQARVTLEAKNGSKADSETSQDTKGLVNGYGRKLLAGVIRGILKQNVADNFGKDDAERFTSIVKAGEAEKHDQAGLLTSLGSIGYVLAPSQLQAVDQLAGMPVRDPEEDARHAAEALKAQQAAAGDTPGAGVVKGDKPPVKAPTPGPKAPAK